METTLTTGANVLTPTVQTWSLDKAHAKLGFNVTHMLVSEVHGSFKTFEAKITSEGEGFENANIELSADINSINTDNTDRDNHLKNADFFEATKFPTLTFKSTSIDKVADNKYILKGELTMLGITKSVTLNVLGIIGTHPFNKKTIAGFKATGTIKRADFNLGSSVPGMIVSDKVEITANAEFIKD